MGFLQAYRLLSLHFNHKLGISSCSHTLKKANRMLTECQKVLAPPHSAPQDRQFWKIVWMVNGFIPQVKLFTWKAVPGLCQWGGCYTQGCHMFNRVVPYVQSKARRSHTCMLFSCQHARVIWFISPLGFQTHVLQGTDTAHLLEQVWNGLDQQQVSLTIFFMWSIWKSTCAACVNGRKRQELMNVVQSTLALYEITHTCRLITPLKNCICMSAQPQQMHTSGHHCWVDGLYRDPDQGGSAYLITKDSHLVQYEFKYCSNAFFPFLMEACGIYANGSPSGSSNGSGIWMNAFSIQTRSSWHLS